MSDSVETKPVDSVSIGAGIAIAGIWLTCTTATVIFALIIFLWHDPQMTSRNSNSLGALFTLLLIAAPMMAAYSITKVILNKEW